VPYNKSVQSEQAGPLTDPFGSRSHGRNFSWNCTEKGHE